MVTGSSWAGFELDKLFEDAVAKEVEAVSGFVSATLTVSVRLSKSLMMLG